MTIYKVIQLRGKERLSLNDNLPRPWKVNYMPRVPLMAPFDSEFFCYETLELVPHLPSGMGFEVWEATTDETVPLRCHIGAPRCAFGFTTSLSFRELRDFWDISTKNIRQQPGYSNFTDLTLVTNPKGTVGCKELVLQRRV